MTVDVTTGELTLQCLDGLVNNLNATTLQTMRCNMDIKFIGSGTAVKAIMYCITDYILKSQLKAHVAYATLELAVTKLGSYNPGEDLMTVCTKNMLQKCANSMISWQELSGQFVATYLLDFQDHYMSHRYRKLFWTNFESHLNSQLPSPECYTKIAVHTEDKAAQRIITVDVDDDGNLVKKSPYVLDYVYRGNKMDPLWLWNFIAQVDKVCSKRTWNVEESVEDDTAVWNGDKGLSCSSAIDDMTYQKTTVSFQNAHDEASTHSLAVRHPSAHLIVVPVGPAIPRRDQPHAYPHYCCLMLLLFQPWR
ncbi:hypothetical protein L208DRAFT_1266138, partial [Tricholoma matsutake]